MFGDRQCIHCVGEKSRQPSRFCSFILRKSDYLVSVFRMFPNCICFSLFGVCSPSDLNTDV